MSRRLSIVLSMTLFISLFINTLLIFKLNKTFIKLQLTRTIPSLNLADSHHDRNSHPYSELIIIGDSRAQMWKLPSHLQQQFKIKNRGVGGYTSSQVLQSFNSQNKQLTKKIILLQVGINDFHWISTIPKSQKKQIITNLKNNIESLVSQFVIHENKVILTTIFPPQQPSLTRYIHWPENGYDIIKDLNEHIRSLSLKANVKLLDSHKLLVSKDLYSLNYTFEDEDFFLHINQRGYQALNKELNKILFQF